MNTQKTPIIAATVLAMGLAASAFVLGTQFKNLRQTGVITVKGLAEAEHKATVGTWRVNVSVRGETYADTLEQTNKHFTILQNFINKQLGNDAQTKSGEVEISNHYEDYVDEQGKSYRRQDGYDGERSLFITTKNLDKLQKALVQIQQLRAKNDTIEFGKPQYYLENLETIKRDLIAKATEDAYVRAQEFAKTSHAKVGAMKSASQGSFNIQSTSPDSEDSDDSYGGSYDTSSIEKNVRLVVTIEYAIE